MDLGQITDIAISGLRAQRARMATSASNIANADTTRTAEGGPYQRRDPVFQSARLEDAGFQGKLDRALRQVDVPKIVADPGEPIERYLPGHPDADEAGMVAFPRVNVIEEMTRVMNASRSYEANLAVMRKVRAMGDATMRIGR
ncbi:MAG: flagellar basal body rod protein FlgC [Myxococcales bacterium]|nr:flagellar basal body rod protein FlgC [Myxococcales bacterium]